MEVRFPQESGPQALVRPTLEAGGATELVCFTKLDKVGEYIRKSGEGAEEHREKDRRTMRSKTSLVQNQIISLQYKNCFIDRKRLNLSCLQ